MYSLCPVPPASLRAHWLLIRDGLKAVMDKGHAEWIPEEIYTAIATGHAQLYLVRKDEQYVGFFVLTVRVEPDGTTKTLIWVAYAEPGNSDAVDWALGQIEQAAIANHHASTVLYSSRKGWIRRLAPRGYKVTEYKIEKELNR